LLVCIYLKINTDLIEAYMIRLRFAPSPTGWVHVGNARTALFNYLQARKSKGVLVLRIEDTDLKRSELEYEDRLIGDLKWLGIQWDEGPDVKGNYGPYRQSERRETYKRFAHQLTEQSLAYYCFCSQGELSAPCECRKLDMENSKKRVALGEIAAIRFKIPKDKSINFYDIVRGSVTFESNLLNDPVILRSNGMPAYNFSVVIDDSLMKIDLVVRGEDHISNTARQIVIYQSLGFKIPKFAHLSMVMGSDNSKLSKRHGSISVTQFREEGYLPEALLNYLALLGWSPPDDKRVIFSKKQLINSFSLSKVSKSAAIFDYKKLNWMNREHIRLVGNKKLGKLIIPFLRKEGFHFSESEIAVEWIGDTAKVLSNYEYTLLAIASKFKQFTRLADYTKVVKMFSNSEESKVVVNLFYKAISKLKSPIEFSKIGEIFKEIQKREGIKGKALYHPLRLALTGEDSGIELKDFIGIIEAGSVLNTKPKIYNMVSRLKLFIQ
jgi:glutamyl-tRNA synthetase